MVRRSGRAGTLRYVIGIASIWSVWLVVLSFFNAGICDFYLGFQNKEEVQDKSIPRNFTTSYRELPKSFRNEISDGFLKNVKFERFRDLVQYLRKKSGILYLRLFGWTRREKNKGKMKELENKVYELTCELATVKFTVLIMEREIKSLIKEDFHFE